MSDTSQGPGWWIASDGKWYAPELAADYVPPAPEPPAPEPPAPEPPAPAAEPPAPAAADLQSEPTTEETPAVVVPPDGPPPMGGPPLAPPPGPPLAAPPGPPLAAPPGPPLAPPPGAYGAPAAPPPAPAKSGNGCLKAFLIVSAIVAVLAIAVFVLVAFVFKKGVDTLNDKVAAQDKIEQQTGIKSSSFNTEHPPQRDISVDDMDCTVDSSGDMMASGTVKNHSSKTSVYTVTISFRRNGVEVASASDVLPTVDAGQTASWTANSATPAQGPFICKIYEIERVDVEVFTSTTTR